MGTSFLYLLSLTSALIKLIIAKDASAYLNYCPATAYDKKVPGPEPALFGECTPWRNRACCNSSSTVAFHNHSAWMNFTWNHCPGSQLSEKCRKRFLQDLCFFECSPNTGPWIQQKTSGSVRERPVNMPLCNSTCNNWWNDCLQEYTCSDNWSKGYNFTSGTIQCSTTSCRTFQDVFKDAGTFCNQIWDHTWQVVPDSQPCMKVQFNASSNPNDDVARWRANQLGNKSNSLKADMVVISLMVVLFVMLKVVTCSHDSFIQKI